MDILARLDLSVPLIQAPMAGVSTPLLAAEVSNAGALGSIGLGASDAAGARAMIRELRERTDRPFNVNLFTHRPATANPERESAWLARLAPLFAEFGATPPVAIREIYRSFVEDTDMLDMLLEERPAVVSFHFGLPPQATIDALRRCGAILMASATSLSEARAIEDSGIDIIVAQGIEAGGHRGVFDPRAPDEALETFALTKLLASSCSLPVVAAGGLMNGADIARALNHGAVAAQLGTAFIGCDESAADPAYRAALKSPASEETMLTSAISGRPARALSNRFTQFAKEAALTTADDRIPDYPIAYDAGKALNAAAKACGESGYGAQWAGCGAPKARFMSAAKLVQTLRSEFLAAAE